MVGLALLLLAAAPNPDLANAEGAYRLGRYDLVLPSVDRALATPLEPAERRRAYELKALTAAAFDDTNAAVDAFRRLLGVDPAYTPSGRPSPKLQGLVAEAVRLGPIGGKRVQAPVVAAPSPPPAPPPVPSLVRRPWFWVAVAVAGGLAAGAAVYAVSTAGPPTTLPLGTLHP